MSNIIIIIKLDLVKVKIKEKHFQENFSSKKIQTFCSKISLAFQIDRNSIISDKTLRVIFN